MSKYKKIFLENLKKFYLPNCIQSKNNKKNRGFTLVELIVVITILAILGTISFIAYQNYTKSARDGTRIADINMIKQNLGLFITDKGFYPNPDNGAMIKYDGALVRTQGTIGDTVTINLGRMSKKPVDPLTDNEYTYSVANNRVEYQIGAISEEGAMAYIPNLLINNTYAASGKKATAMVTGTYNEKFLKVNTGGINYILAIPTIISADITDTDVTSIIANNKLVYDNYSNLPESYKNNGYTMTGGFDFNPINLVVFSGGTTYLDSEANKLTFATNLQDIYKNSILSTEGTYQEIFNTANDTDKVFLVNNYISNNVGGITGQVSEIIYHTCNLDGQTINHDTTITAYSETSIESGQSYDCVDRSIEMTCNDGVWSSDPLVYKYTFCEKLNPIINGLCGNSNGQNLTSEPTTGLCDTGNASTITGSWPWTWTCEGINGGTTANCSTTTFCMVDGIGVDCIIP